MGEIEDQANGTFGNSEVIDGLGIMFFRDAALRFDFNDNVLEYDEVGKEPVG